MFFHSTLTDEQFLRYLLAREAIAYLGKHILLAFRYVAYRLSHLRARRIIDHLLEQFLREVELAIVDDSLYGHLDLLEVAALEQETSYAKIDQLSVVFPFTEHRQYDNLQVGVDAESLLCSGDAVDVGHRDIEEHQVGFLSIEMSQKFSPVGSLEIDMHGRQAVEQCLEASPEKLMVVDEPDASRLIIDNVVSFSHL